MTWNSAVLIGTVQNASHMLVINVTIPKQTTSRWECCGRLAQASAASWSVSFPLIPARTPTIQTKHVT